MPITPYLAYDVPENPCPRIYCVTNGDERTNGDYWEDIKDKGETSGDFLRDGVPRYVKCRPKQMFVEKPATSTPAICDCSCDTKVQIKLIRPANATGGNEGR